MNEEYESTALDFFMDRLGNRNEKGGLRRREKYQKCCIYHYIAYFPLHLQRCTL